MLLTERLVIKPYDEADRASMLELLTNESIRDSYILPVFGSAAEAGAYFEKLKRNSLSEEHYERGLYLKGELIGFVNDVNMENHVIEIGYAVHPAHHNKGYATEAITAVIGELFRKGYREVKAAAFAGNAASRRVMEKCGMRLTEETSSIVYRGKNRQCVYYAVCSDSCGVCATQPSSN